jgi:small subunit ribosomal protein S17
LKIDIHIQFILKHYQNKKYLAHDELEECNIGDQVLVEECRPLSKRKRWKLIKILSKSSLIS